jgi:hypothetical protein
MSANCRLNAVFNKQLAAVETFERGTKMGGVFGKADLVYRGPNIHRDGVYVCKAELLESEQQVSAVQAAAKHGDNGSIFLAELCDLPKAFNGPAFLEADNGLFGLR